MNCLCQYVCSFNIGMGLGWSRWVGWGCSLAYARMSSLAVAHQVFEQNDNSFWMEHSDFRKIFDYLQICKPTSLL
jgi:hypothetical protein